MYYENSAIRRAVMVGFAPRTRLRSPLDETQSAVRLLTLHSVMRLLNSLVMSYLQIYL